MAEKKEKRGNRGAIKKAILPPRKPTPASIVERIVIVTKVNDRDVFISNMSTTNAGKRFIPHYTADRDEAKDFLTQGIADDHIAMLHPGACGHFKVRRINIPISNPQILTDDTE